MDLKMKTFIVNRNTPDLAENQKRQIELMNKRIPSLDNEIIIYNCEEEPFRGKCNGHHTFSPYDTKSISLGERNLATDLSRGV